MKALYGIPFCMPHCVSRGDKGAKFGAMIDS